jgi:hypothetical protein
MNYREKSPDNMIKTSILKIKKEKKKKERKRGQAKPSPRTVTGYDFFFKRRIMFFFFQIVIKVFENKMR